MVEVIEIKRRKGLSLMNVVIGVDFKLQSGS